MENKYFTPDIEDIRVGYEYEYLSGHPQEEGNTSWNKWTLDKGDPFIGWRLDGFKRLIEQKMIRTPFLTKEQIEAEGWNFLGDELYTRMDDGHEISCELHPINRIHIYYLENNEVDSRFFGECKDINTFRQIQKLLKI